MNQPQDESLLLSHDYDGIQEYDNPLPGWWTNLFLLTILFSVVYLLFFHTGAPGRSMIEQYDASGVALAKKQFGQLGELQQDRATLARFMKDE
ncbi:MAG: cbb3-type cytochrome c oxidase N-terminal domain-containing protein, partial [Pirellulaceae bacterium]